VVSDLPSLDGGQICSAQVMVARRMVISLEIRGHHNQLCDLAAQPVCVQVVIKLESGVTIKPMACVGVDLRL
jgi:hypothetical protein